MPKSKAFHVTIDTSCLIAIEHLNLFRELTFLFDQIHLPKRVREEFCKHPKSRKTLKRVCKELAPFKACNVADEITINILLAEVAARQTKPRQHEGEAETVVQAQRLEIPTVMIDEKVGRRWARQQGLECRGTLWLLEQLRNQEFIPAIRPMIEILNNHNLRLPKQDVRKLLDRFAEE